MHINDIWQLVISIDILYFRVSRAGYGDDAIGYVQINKTNKTLEKLT